MGKACIRQRYGSHYSDGASRLRRYLTRTGTSPSALALQLGCGRTSVFRWLYGDRSIPLATALAVERLTAIPVSAWDRPPRSRSAA